MPGLFYYFLKDLFIFNVYEVLACMYVCSFTICTIYRVSEEGSGFPETRVTVIKSHVGTRKQICVRYKSSKYSYPLSHFSVP